jgi:putative ABC transport system permease protein
LSFRNILGRQRKIFTGRFAVILGVALITVGVLLLAAAIVETIIVFWPSVATVFGTLSQSLATGFGLFYEFLKSFMDLAATPVQGLFSFLGITVPKEIAAGVTFGIVVVAVILFARSSFTRFTRIAFRNVPRRKLRNSLTVLAIILGVTLVVGVNVAFDDVYAQFKQTINQAVGNVDISIRSAVDVPFNQSVLATVSNTDGVANAFARVTSSVEVAKNQKWFSTTMIGVNTDSDFDYLDAASNNITGAKYFGLNSSDAVVDEGLNYTIGDNFVVRVTTVSGTTPKFANYSFNVVGIYHPSQTQTSPLGGYTGHTMYVEISKAQNLGDYGSKVDSIGLKVADLGKTDQVVSRLSSRLGTDYVVDPVKESLLKTIDQATSGLRDGLQIMSVMALCVAIVIVLNTIYMNVGERTHEIGILRSQGASTGQVFWIFFSESLILGIIGVTTGLFSGIFMKDVFRYLTDVLFQSSSAKFTLDFTIPSTAVPHLILGAFAGFLTVIIGGLFPSLAASRTTIINALRPSMRKPGKPRTALKLVALGLPLTVFGMLIYIWFDFFAQFGYGLFVVSVLAPIPMAGVTLLAAGLLRRASPVVERVLIGFGKTRKIISRNIERNLLRSTICFALIGMSFSFVILMSGAQIGTVMGVENVIRSFSSSDLTVTSKTLISKTFADNLTINDASINCTTPVLIVPQRTILQANMRTPLNSSSAIMAIDPASYPKVMSMAFSANTPSDVFMKLNESGTIILTSPLAQSLNVTTNDVIKMRVVSMTQFGLPILAWKNFTVVGIAQGAFLDIMSIGHFQLSEASYISYNSLNNSFPTYDNMSDLFFVKANTGQNLDQIKDQITKSYGDKYELGITTFNDTLERVRGPIDQIFYILYAVVMFAVVNAAIGVTAIMVMNVAERRRELGILRSQGMSKFQVVTSIIGEATFLGVIGFFVGTVVGLIFHRVTVSFMRLEGFPMPFIIPYNAIELSLVLAMVTTIIGAVYPAYHASRLNIVEALRH